MLLAALAFLLVTGAAPQESTAFDGAVFQFTGPAGIQVSESADGTRLFTEVRGAVSAEGGVVPTLSLVFSPSAGAAPATGAVNGLVAELSRSSKPVRLSVLATEQVTHTVGGRAVECRRVTWGRDNAAVQVIDVGAWHDGDAVFGFSMSCSAVGEETERAQFEALLASVRLKPFDSTSTRLLQCGYAALPVPLFAAVKSVSTGDTTLYTISTPEGQVFVHFGVMPDDEGKSATAEEAWLRRQSQELKSTIEQQGGAYLGVEDYLHPWHDHIAQGQSHRLRQADGALFEMRSLRFSPKGSLLVVWAELRGDAAAAQRARLDAIARAVPHDGRPRSEQTLVVAGLRFVAPNHLTGSWLLVDGKLTIAEKQFLGRPAPHTVFAHQLSNTGAPDPIAVAQLAALRAAGLEGAIVQSTNVGEAQVLGGMVSTHTQRLLLDGATFLVRSAAITHGERVVVSSFVSRSENETSHDALWRRSLASAQPLETVDGRAMVRLKRSQFALPNNDWVARTSETVSGHERCQVRHRNAEVEVNLSTQSAAQDFAGKVLVAERSFESYTGLAPDAAAQPFGASRRLGNSVAAVRGAVLGSRLIRVLGTRDVAGDGDLRTNAPLDDEQRAATEVDALLDSFTLTNAPEEIRSEHDSFGVAFELPEGLVLEEVFYEGLTNVAIRSEAASSAALNFRILNDRTPGSVDRAFENSVLDLSFTLYGATIELWDDRAKMHVSTRGDGTARLVPAIHVRAGATDESPAHETFITACSFGPYVVSLDLSGTPHQVAESGAMLREVLARLNLARLVVHRGSAEAGFAFEATEVEASTRVAPNGAIEVVLKSARGDELVCSHYGGAWSTRPALSDTNDPALRDSFDTLVAGGHVGATRAWSNAHVRTNVPATGELTEHERGFNWSDPKLHADFRLTVWPDQVGEVELSASLRDSTDWSGAEGAVARNTWRIEREVVGRPTLGLALHARFEDAPSFERHHLLTRHNGVEVNVALTFRPDDLRSRAAAEHALHALRLTDQPTTPGRLVQSTRSNIVVPWFAATELQTWANGAESFWIRFTPTAAILISLGSMAAEVEAKEVDALGAHFTLPTEPGAPIELTIAGAARSGESWSGSAPARRFRFQHAGRHVHWLSFYGSPEELEAWRAWEARVAAALQVR